MPARYAAPITSRDGIAHVGTKRGTVIALRLDDGRELWRFGIRAAVRSLGFHGDVMYVGTVPARCTRSGIR